MAPSKKSKGKAIPSPPPLSSAFIPAISTVAVAQICVSAGYDAAEPAALRSLSSIASLYLQTLARSASSIAASKGRTQSNILDLVRAIEDLTADHIGFAGASNPTRPLLESSILKDLRSFVRRVREVPFPKPIRKEKGAALQASDRVSHVPPPPPHVPRWLPGFPAVGGEERRERGEERRRWEEKGGIFEGEREEIEERKELGVLMVKRERVRFKLAAKNSSIIMKKRLMLFGVGDGDEHCEMRI